MFKRNQAYLHPELSDVLSQSKKRRGEWFDNLIISHLNLKSTLDDLLDCLLRNKDTRLVFLIGMTGAGKTNLAENALADALTSLWGDNGGTKKPFLYVPVETNNENRFAWKNLFGGVLKQGSAAPIEFVRETSKSDGVIKYANNNRLSLGALREAIRRMADERCLKVIIFDEAYNFLRFDNLTIINTAISFAEQMNVKLLFIGSYELLELSTLHSTQIRRTEVIPFFRYDTNNKTEMAEFRVILDKFTSNWPCKLIPNFLSAADELAAASMGGVGQLSVILSNFLGRQLRTSGEAWTASMFGKALKAAALDEEMREQIIEGEAELRRKYGTKNFWCTKKGIAAIGEKLGL